MTQGFILKVIFPQFFSFAFIPTKAMHSTEAAEAIVFRIHKQIMIRRSENILIFGIDPFTMKWGPFAQLKLDTKL